MRRTTCGCGTDDGPRQSETAPPGRRPRPWRPRRSSGHPPAGPLRPRCSVPRAHHVEGLARIGGAGGDAKRRQVNQRVGALHHAAPPRRDRGYRRGRSVTVDRGKGRRDVGLRPARQVVEDDDTPRRSRPQQHVDRRRADQAGAAGDDDGRAVDDHAAAAPTTVVRARRRSLAGTPATTENGSTSSVTTAPGADDGALADSHARQDHGVDADIGPSADAHRLDLEVGRDDRHVCGNTCVLGAEHLGAGTPADMRPRSRDRGRRSSSADRSKRRRRSRSCRRSAPG